MPAPDPVIRSQDGTPQRRRPVQFNKAAVIRELFEALGDVATSDIQHAFTLRTGGGVSAGQVNNIRRQMFQPDEDLAVKLRTMANRLINQLGLQGAHELLNQQAAPAA